MVCNNHYKKLDISRFKNKFRFFTWIRNPKKTTYTSFLNLLIYFILNSNSPTGLIWFSGCENPEKPISSPRIRSGNFIFLILINLFFIVILRFISTVIMNIVKYWLRIHDAKTKCLGLVKSRGATPARTRWG